jgi:hypothetical protein
MHNRRFLELAAEEMRTQILAMPKRFTSLDYYTAFAKSYPKQYEGFVRIYTDRGRDRPHAIQTVHSQLMHTINSCFHHLARKVRTIQNPKGGDMSDWVRE